MSKVIAIANQKGGVSKTTTTVNLGIGLARKGKKVLVIDADPQSSLTESLGFHQTDQLEVTLSSIMEKIIRRCQPLLFWQLPCRPPGLREYSWG